MTTRSVAVVATVCVLSFVMPIGALGRVMPDCEAALDGEGTTTIRSLAAQRGAAAPDKAASPSQTSARSRVSATTATQPPLQPFGKDVRWDGTHVETCGGKTVIVANPPKVLQKDSRAAKKNGRLYGENLGIIFANFRFVNAGALRTYDLPERQYLARDEQAIDVMFTPENPEGTVFETMPEYYAYVAELGALKRTLTRMMSAATLREHIESWYSDYAASAGGYLAEYAAHGRGAPQEVRAAWIEGYLTGWELASSIDFDTFLLPRFDDNIMGTLPSGDPLGQ